MAKSKAIQTETIKIVEEAKKTGRIKEDPAGVMVDLIRQQRSTYAKEMDHVLSARQAALNPYFPQRNRLYDIYDDMVLDETIHGHMYNHRILPVKNRSFKIVNAAGEKDLDKTKLLQKRWFDKFIQYALESKFFGFSLAYFEQMQFENGINEVEKLVLIPRRHVLQEKGFILKWENDFTGVSFYDEPVSNYVLPIGDCEDLGLLNKAATLWIMKKHAWQNWDQFAEIFGIPIRVVKTASDDPRVRSEIEGWVRDMGTAAYGVFPDGTDIEIKENNKTDAYKVFFEMINAANTGLAILFSGQTMTSMDGSSRSQAEVHAEVAEQIRKDDEKFIAYEVHELIELLREKHGYPFDEGDTFEWDVPEDVEGLIVVFKAVNEMGFELDPEEVSNRLGVKILGKKAPVIPPVDANNPTPPKPGDPKEEPPAKEDLTVKEILKLHAEMAKAYSHT